jgi:hypothetical protein
MSRIQKYKESLHKFIKDKTYLMQNNEDNLINDFLYEKIKDDDLIFPILLLTVMNNQNKKNHISMQGYYIASCIEFLNLSLFLIENSSELIIKFGFEIYNKMVIKLFISASKSLQQNMESIRNTFQSKPDVLTNIIINSLNIFNNTLIMINTFDIVNNKLIVTNNNCNNDIVNWYLKTNTDLINKFKTFKQVTKESLQYYVEKKYISICESAISLGWIIGGGDYKGVIKIKKSAKYFGIMYKLSKDFENLSTDINNPEKYKTNYVLNFGLQDGYEAFLHNKEKFLEELMLFDLYTNTIKEIVDTIEMNVDVIIDQTSPDLKSNYSTPPPAHK